MIGDFKSVERDGDHISLVPVVEERPSIEFEVVTEVGKDGEKRTQMEGLPDAIKQQLQYMFTRQDIAQAPDMCLAILLRKSAASKRSLT